MYHDANRYYIYRGNCWKVFKEFKMKKVLRAFFHKFEPDLWTARVEGTYMSALRYECYDIDDLKSAENYIDVKNGLLNLDAEEITLMPHDKTVYSTTQIPIIYDNDAKCPEFKNFLRTIFKRDKELIRLVQEIMGYCLSNSVKAHKMFIFLGEGSNGKSVLCEIMMALAGGIENVSTVALKDFGSKFSLSQIADKTLNISTENETDTNLDTQLLKAITSGEPVQMEEKFQSPFSYKPYVKLAFAMNSLPYVKDKSYGFERRLVVIPFDVRFVDHQPRTRNELEGNPYLSEILMDELDGILAFAIRGLLRLRKNDYKFTSSKKAQRALEQYKEKIDPMLAYVRSNVEEDEEAEKINMSRFREHYQNWCREEGHEKLAKISAQTFWDTLRRVLKSEGFVYRKFKADKQFIKGIRVKGLNDKDKMTKTIDELGLDEL